MSLLENYYDLNKVDRFEALFGELAIGKNPTAGHNRYLVLKWDFSEVSPIGDGEEIKCNLYDYLNIQIGDFPTYIGKHYPSPFGSIPKTLFPLFNPC